MSGKQQAKINTAKKAQDQKLPQLQQLSLEQLDDVAAAQWVFDPLHPASGPDGYRWQESSNLRDFLQKFGL